MARLFISAAHKSSGKTTLTLGLCAAFRARGLTVQAFKKGPDYIDPIWLGRASGRPCYNLDFNTASADEIDALFARKSEGCDLALIEGNKGLHDGMSLDGSDSNAALAKQLAAPVILVLDTRGMTRGVAPIVNGFVAFDRQVDIAGVILNRVGGSRHEGKLRQILEAYSDVPVVGAVPAGDEMAIDERHLGLVPGNEWGGAAEKVQAIAGRIEACVDLDRIYAIAGAAAPLEAIARTADALPAGDRTPLKIGIARDSAFGFYYPDDLEAMQAAGAELVFFDTLKDRSLPRVDGVFIGGGFPETHIEELAANTGMLSSLKTAIDLGTPVYAECGGLMYLARRLHYRGVARYMAGALDFDVEMHERPQGRGYIRLQDTASHPWRRYAEDPEAPAQIAAHEFHYSAVVDPGAHPLEFAYDVKRGRGIDGRHDGVMRNNLFASYAHLRNTRAYRWTDRFLAFVRDRRRT